MTDFFDGNKVAKGKRAELVEIVEKLKDKGINPKLVTILVGENPASKLFLSLKKKRADEIGIILEVKKFDEKSSVELITNYIKNANRDGSIHGIMVQFPLPNNFSLKDRDKIIDSISKSKDVDGLGKDSLYITPVVKAVLGIMKHASKYLQGKEPKVVVVGARGFEGEKILKTIKEMGYKVTGVDKETRDLMEKTKKADVLISVTGESGLLKKDMVKAGVVAIDVGSPMPDFEKNVYQKASFVSPVPGGVGPLTITNLLENLIEAAK